LKAGLETRATTAEGAAAEGRLTMRETIWRAAGEQAWKPAPRLRDTCGGWPFFLSLMGGVEKRVAARTLCPDSPFFRENHVRQAFFGIGAAEFRPNRAIVSFLPLVSSLGFRFGKRFVLLGLHFLRI
jgi:hypothetical protein